MKEKGADAVEIAQRRRHLHLLEKLQKGKPLSAPEMNELSKLEDKKKPQQIKGTIDADQLIKTQAEAARYVGVSERTIRRWVKNGMARTADKYYIKSILEVYKQNEGDKPSEARGRKQEAEATLKTHQAALMELELAKEKQEWISAANVRKVNIEKVLVLKRTLLNQGSRLMDCLSMKTPEQVKDILDEDNRHTINVFAGEEVC